MSPALDKLKRFSRRLPDPVRSRLVSVWVAFRDACWRLKELLWTFAVVPRSVARLKGEKRILGVFNFREHGAFLGDMMEFLAILNVLREDHGVSKVDICYVDDESNPNHPPSLDRYLKLPGYKEMAMSMRALLPSVGSVFWFDSDILFERFFRAMYRRYIPWPRYSYLHSWPSCANYSRIPKDGTVYPNVFAPLHAFYAKRGRLPLLSCPPGDRRWAWKLFQERVMPAVPIAVQIRFNPDSSFRDTNLPLWTDFFRRMERRPDVKFVVVCRREEVVPELRALKNIVFSKDFGSNVLQDLAVIQMAHFSMFPGSGLATFPWFCGMPSFTIHSEFYSSTYKRNGLKGPDERLPFLTPFQRMRWGEYSADTIEEEFESLWADLRKAGWENPCWKEARDER